MHSPSTRARNLDNILKRNASSLNDKTCLQTPNTVTSTLKGFPSLWWLLSMWFFILDWLTNASPQPSAWHLQETKHSSKGTLQTRDYTLKVWDAGWWRQRLTCAVCPHCGWAGVWSVGSVCRSSCHNRHMKMVSGRKEGFTSEEEIMNIWWEAVLVSFASSLKESNIINLMLSRVMVSEASPGDTQLLTNPVCLQLWASNFHDLLKEALQSWNEQIKLFLICILSPILNSNC